MDAKTQALDIWRCWEEHGVDDAQIMIADIEHALAEKQRIIRALMQDKVEMDIEIRRLKMSLMAINEMLSVKDDK